MMKSSKLIEIFKQGNMVIPIYFLQHYRDFKLSMEEFIFLMYLYNMGNKFLFDPVKFSSDLNMELTEVMNYVGVLTDKHFIRVEVLKNEKGLMEEVVIMEEFYNKLSMITIDEVNKTSINDNSNIFEIIEKEFGRTLSPIEFEIIKAWLDGGFSEELIKEAIKEATMNNVSNLRYIDKILFEWGKAGIKSSADVEKNRKMRNDVKNKHDENIDLDIIDYNWFDDDDE
ncbi:MAG: DnaD domain protein [Mycoplasmatota bacterium]|nr:DnaD domain protein [Mycoplasmatota bacterium]